MLFPSPGLLRQNGAAGKPQLNFHCLVASQPSTPRNQLLLLSSSDAHYRHWTLQMLLILQKLCDFETNYWYLVSGTIPR